MTDDAQYEAMRDSFSAAGFTEALARFTRLVSAARPGEPEPYRTITKLCGESPELYVLLCHQDIRVSESSGVDSLIRCLDELTRRDSRWAVAGNAGGTDGLELIRYVTDRHGGSTSHALPARVHSLDENLLVLRTERRPRCSEELRGFHFYGTDVCLNAIFSGDTCYVIPFHVRHLGVGDTTTREFATARSEFLRVWSPRTPFRYVRTPNETLFLSRSKALRAIFGSDRAIWRVMHHRSLAATNAAGMRRLGRGRAPDHHA